MEDQSLDNWSGMITRMVERALGPNLKEKYRNENETRSVQTIMAFLRGRETYLQENPSLPVTRPSGSGYRVTPEQGQDRGPSHEEGSVKRQPHAAKWEGRLGDSPLAARDREQGLVPHRQGKPVEKSNPFRKESARAELPRKPIETWAIPVPANERKPHVGQSSTMTERKLINGHPSIANEGSAQRSLRTHNPAKCVVCGGKHSILACKDLMRLSVRARWRRLKILQVCPNCFSTEHWHKQCTEKGCEVCGPEYHHHPEFCRRQPPESVQPGQKAGSRDKGSAAPRKSADRPERRNADGAAKQPQHKGGRSIHDKDIREIISPEAKVPPKGDRPRRIAECKLPKKQTIARYVSPNTSPVRVERVPSNSVPARAGRDDRDSASTQSTEEVTSNESESEKTTDTQVSADSDADQKEAKRLRKAERKARRDKKLAKILRNHERQMREMTESHERMLAARQAEMEHRLRQSQHQLDSEATTRSVPEPSNHAGAGDSLI